MDPPSLSGRTRLRGPRAPSLSIDTDLYQPTQLQPSASLEPESTTSPSRLRSASISLVNTLRASTSSSADPSPSALAPRGDSAHNQADRTAHATSKGKGEARKLLSHLLDQLRRAISQAGGVFGSAAAGSKGKGKAVESDSDDEDDVDAPAKSRRRSRAPDWGTQAFTLMQQLRDVLVLAEKQHWDIFVSSDANDHDPGPASPSSPSSPRGRFMRSGSSSQPPPSSTSPGNPVSGSNLLNSTVQLLADITLVASETLPAFRPSMPPLSLQSITLDVATLLLATTRGRPRDTVAVAMAMLGALQGWGEGMTGRVIVFFDSFLTDALAKLARTTGRPQLPGRHSSSRSGAVPAIAIQVDEPDEGDSNGPAGPLDVGDRASSSSWAGDQPLVVYQLSALVAPLLSVALASISPLQSSMVTLYRLHKMIESLVALKEDLYLDLLETVAYGAATDRRAALGILTSFWPKALGQPSIAQPFPPVSYRDDVYRLETQTMRLPSRASEHVAHLIPWRFDGGLDEGSRPASRSFYGGDEGTPSPPQDALPCIECGQPVLGFGLLSLSGPYEPVHLRCHNSPEGSFMSQYVTDNQTNRIAAARYSLVPAPRRAALVATDDPQDDRAMPPIAVRVDAHRFRLVNIFTLVPCFICHLPLWGATAQGHKCVHCRQFAHHGCVTDPAVSPFPPCQLHESHPIADITVDHKALRRDFLSYYRDIVFDEQQLAAMSYEEVAVFHMLLWTQKQLLDAGVAAGTIVVRQVGPTKQAREAIDRFELHWLEQLYGAYKGSETLPHSHALGEFKAMHGDLDTDNPVDDDVAVRDSADCFSLPLLVFVTALMRSPVEVPNPELSFSAPDEAAPGRCFETIEVSLMHEILARDFGLRHPVASRHFLEHLLHLGLFERKDGRLLLFPRTSTTPPSQSRTTAIFPLPFLIDPSPSVESLVVAIESCLRDLDLSVQEAGLLLLVRRCWPSPFASAYALERLTRAVLRWLLDDSTLLAVTREQVASVNARYADGSRSTHHSKAGSTSGGGGDYVLQRKLLVERLAARWLRALHDQDPQQYGEVLFRQTAVVSAAAGMQAFSSLQGSESERTVAFTELLLRNLIRLYHSDVVFSVYDNLFSRWLDEVAATWLDLARDDVPLSFKSLVRLFQAEGIDPSTRKSRASVMLTNLPMSDEPSALLGSPSGSSTPTLDPWKVLVDTSLDGVAGLKRSLRWLRILAQSGVDASFEVFEHLETLCAAPNGDFADSVDLSEALFASAWSRGINRRAMAGIAVRLYLSQHDFVKASLDNDRDTEVTLIFMRRALGAFLLATGCSGENLVKLGFTTASEARVLGGSRKRHSMLDTSISEIICPTEFLQKLTEQCQSEVFVARGVIARFLYSLLAGKQALGSRDAVIKANPGVLSSCIFRLFDLNQPDLTEVRIQLLLVLLSADGPTFHRLLKLVCTSEAWEHRFTTLDILFLMITELHIPASGSTPAGSLHAFFPVILRFFNSLWDPEEAVRQKVETLIQSLRPSHCSVMAQSLQSHFNLGNVADRLELCKLLTLIRVALPTWQVLSWSTVIDGLFAQELSLKSNLEPRDNFDDDEELWLQLLNVALLMVAEGIELDRPSTLVKIKYHVLKAFGFQDVSLRPLVHGGSPGVFFAPGAPTVQSTSLATLASLKRVLDCSKHVMTRMWAERSHGEQESANDLVGSAFLDVVPAFVNSGVDLGSLTYIQLRDTLECLAISIFKHNLTGQAKLDVFEAVRGVTTLLVSEQTAYDNRVLVLLTCTSLLKKYDVVDILPYQVLVVTQMMALRDGDALWAQGTVFLHTAFHKFAIKGLFLLLFKTIPESEGTEKIYDVLLSVMRDGPTVLDRDGEVPLREAPFYDVFRQGLHTHLPFLNAALGSMTRYAETVHSSMWSLALLQNYVQFLARLAQRTSEADASEDFDPNPTVLLVLLVLKNHPQYAQDLLVQLAGLLRMWLPRFKFSRETLSAVISATLTTKKLEQASGQVTSAVGDSLSDGLRGSGMSMPTIGALIDALLLDFGSLSAPGGPADARPGRSALSTLVADDALSRCEDAVSFLRTGFDTPNTRFSRPVFETMCKAGDLVLLAIRIDPACWEACKGQESIQTLRTINVILLSELANASSLSLLGYVTSISTAVTISLRSCLRSASQAPLSLTVVSEHVSQCFANIRLVVLLAARAGDREVVETYWRTVWPACERLLTTNELDGELSAVGTMVWTSFGDLVLYLHQAGSPLPLDNAATWTSLLENLRASGRQDPVGSKFTKALASFSDPPRRLPFATLVDQVSNEVYICSKLRHQIVQGMD